VPAVAKSKNEPGLPRELQSSYAAWGRGDLKTARAEARAILAGPAPSPTPSDEVRAGAERLLSSTGLDSTHLRVGLGSLLVLLTVLALTFLRH
jgi:hypothetical protein